jgi:hypothetical protein
MRRVHATFAANNWAKNTRVFMGTVPVPRAERPIVAAGGTLDHRDMAANIYWLRA